MPDMRAFYLDVEQYVLEKQDERWETAVGATSIEDFCNGTIFQAGMWEQEEQKPPPPPPPPLHPPEGFRFGSSAAQPATTEATGAAGAAGQGWMYGSAPG